MEVSIDDQKNPTAEQARASANGEVATLTAEGGGTNDETPYERQGRSCFFFICDMRRAVVIMSCVGIFFHIAAIVSNKFLLIDSALGDLEEDMDDESDEHGDTLRQLFLIHVIMTCVGIMGYLGSIVGGILFLQPPIRINVAIIITVFTVNTVFFFRAAGEVEELQFSIFNIIPQIIGTVMTTFIHISFSREMSNGIMTKENYPNEQQSCCCV